MMIAKRFTPVRPMNIPGARLAAITMLLWSGRAAAQGDQAAYVFVQGRDTVMVERVTNSRESVTGTIATRGAPSIGYTAEITMSPSGPSVRRMTFRVLGPGATADAAPLQVGSMSIGADSAIVEAGTGSGPQQRAAVAITGDPLPLINGSMVLAGMMVARARASHEQPYRGKFHFLQGPGVPLDATIEFVGSDSAVFTVAGQLHRLRVASDGRIDGGTIPSQGIVISRVTGTAASAISLGRPDYGAPVGAPYAAEEVTVRTPKGHTLSGTLTVPRGGGRFPAVVTITGSGQQDRDEHLSLVPNFRPFRQLADTLGRRGIAVLRLDDRGVNGSGGDLLSATSADFADDIRAGIAFLRARADINPSRIGLYGHSEGGMIAPMIAATDPTLAGIVLAAGPAYDGNRIIQFQLRNLVMGDSSIPGAKKDSAAREQLAQFDATAGRQPWMRFFLAHDPIPTLRRVKVPVLILQGGTDQQVTPEQAPIIERTLRESGNRDVTMRLFAARNHLFLADSVGFPRDYPKIRDGRIGGDVMGPAVDWLVKKLSGETVRP